MAEAEIEAGRTKLELEAMNEAAEAEVEIDRNTDT